MNCGMYYNNKNDSLYPRQAQIFVWNGILYTAELETRLMSLQ